MSESKSTAWPPPGTQHGTTHLLRWCDDNEPYLCGDPVRARWTGSNWVGLDVPISGAGWVYLRKVSPA